MTTLIYNDTEFSVEASDDAWNITRKLPDGRNAVVGSRLFVGLNAADAIERARGLIHAAFPVGVKTIGPDVAHPNLVGDLKIVGPDISHANFANWERDSSSFPAVVEPAARR